MRHLGTFIALMLFVLGVYFIGAGLSGMVTSQTCCLPPSCTPEYECTIVGYSERATPARIDARLGLLFVFAATTAFITHELAVKPRHE
jgi:hypothetical protein